MNQKIEELEDDNAATKADHEEIVEELERQLRAADEDEQALKMTNLELEDEVAALEEDLAEEKEERQRMFYSSRS